MSLFKLVLPLMLNRIYDALPPNHHVNSTVLDGDNIVIVFDDPAKKTGFTFPTEVNLEDIQRDGEARATQAERNRLDQIAESKRLQEEAEQRQIEEDKRMAQAEASESPRAVDSSPATAEDIERAKALVEDEPTALKPVDKQRRRRQS